MKKLTCSQKLGGNIYLSFKTNIAKVVKKQTRVEKHAAPHSCLRNKKEEEILVTSFAHQYHDRKNKKLEKLWKSSFKGKVSSKFKRTRGQKRVEHSLEEENWR